MSEGFEMALTQKQENFIQGLVKGMSQREAYKAAYDCKKMTDKTADETASKLLKNPKIAARYDQLMTKVRERAEEKTLVSVEWVLQNLKEVAERCMQVYPVTDADGNETGEYRFEHSGANKSLELIGKHLAMFTERIDANVKEDITVRVEIVDE